MIYIQLTSLAVAFSTLTLNRPVQPPNDFGRYLLQLFDWQAFQMRKIWNHLDLVLHVPSNQCGTCHAHEQFEQPDRSNDQHSN